jgi:hypothetical protein
MTCSATAQAFGVRYAYFDATYISPPKDGSPINREYVHVAAVELAQLAAILLAGSTQG